MTAPSSILTARRRLLRGFPGFAGVMLLLTFVAAWLLNILFSAPGDRTAIGISAGVAIFVQLGSFPIVKILAARNIMLGWGAGAFIRTMSLLAYTVAADKVLALPLMPALVSLFVFYFLSMVIEPLFLRP